MSNASGSAEHGTPTTTRVAAERGLQAAERSWRQAHSTPGDFELLFTQTGAAAIGFAALLVIILVLRSRRRRDDARVDDKEMGSPSAKHRQATTFGGRMRSVAPMLQRLLVPWRMAWRVFVRLVGGGRGAAERGKGGADMGVEMRTVHHSRTPSVESGVGGLGGSPPPGGRRHVTLGLSSSSSSSAPSGVDPEVAERMRFRVMPTLHGSTSQPPTVLSNAAATWLRGELPLRYNVREWQLVYSTEQHGCSLRTLYAKLAGHDASMIVMLDDHQHIFGAFVAEPWEVHGRYFGNGETFLFSVGRGRSPETRRYDWSRANSHFVLASHDMLAFGGGGKFALYLDSSLEMGSSDRSETFDNDCLAGAREFKCIKLEAWTFV